MATRSAVKRRIYELLEAPRPDDPARHRLESAVFALVFVNASAAILRTVPELDAQHGALLNAIFEATTVGFVLEYLARLWVCTESPGYRHPVWGRLRFALRPGMLFDLVIISPAAIVSLLPTSGAGRALSLLVLLRLFKLVRYSPALQTLGRVLRSRRRDLGITLGALLMLLLAASTAQYVVEHDAQPDRFTSIPATMWWAIATLTTVGYGDIVPVTPLGKILGGCVAILGIGMLALPAGILSSGFADELARSRAAGAPHCPHCGEALPPDLTGR